MDAIQSLQLVQMLSLAGLIGGTIEYIEIVKRRELRRRARREAALAQEAGLRGLVRVLLADEDARATRLAGS